MSEWTPCLDDHGQDECEGRVEYRLALTATGCSFPRCEYHWNRRLDEQERIGRDFPDSGLAPSWFDPSYAGERWDEED
jgi:hypothetical protein